MGDELGEFAKEMGLSPDDLYAMMTTDKTPDPSEDAQLKAAIIASIGNKTGFDQQDLWSLDIDTLLYLASNRQEEGEEEEQKEENIESFNVDELPTDMYQELEKQLGTDEFVDLMRSSPAFRAWAIKTNVWEKRIDRVSGGDLVIYQHENPYWALRAYELSKIKLKSGKLISNDNLHNERLVYEFVSEINPKKTMALGIWRVVWNITNRTNSFIFSLDQRNRIGVPGIVVNFYGNDNDWRAYGPFPGGASGGRRGRIETTIMRGGFERAKQTNTESFFVIDAQRNFADDTITLIQTAIYAIYAEGYRFKSIVDSRGVDTETLAISSHVTSPALLPSTIPSSGKDIKTHGSGTAKYHETSLNADGSIDEKDVSSIRNTAIIVFDKELNFVMVQRQGWRGADEPWMFPGGKIDRGETPWQAVTREWTEETGQVFPAIRNTLFYVDYGRNDPHTRIFIAAILDGQPYTGNIKGNETRRVWLFRRKDGQFPENMVGYVRRSFKFILPFLGQIEDRFEEQMRSEKFKPGPEPIRLVLDSDF